MERIVMQQEERTCPCCGKPNGFEALNGGWISNDLDGFCSVECMVEYATKKD